jgi:hypothetical protein
VAAGRVSDGAERLATLRRDTPIKMRRLPIALLMVATTLLGLPPSGSAQTVGEVFRKVKSHVVFSHVLADGDLVVLHLNSKADEKDRGRAVVGIFRDENGKIVEHRDVIQEVPEETANGNNMF